MGDRVGEGRISLGARLVRLSISAVGLMVAGYLFSRLATLGEVKSVGEPVPSEDVAHLHAIGANPADDRVYLATHTGLLRISRDGRAQRVADRYQDTMGFNVVGPDAFLGSGHPDLREGLPSRLGLIRSDDAGKTWTPLSLSGEADLHAIAAVAGRLYAADATAQQLIASDDEGRHWETVAEVDLGALAVATDGRRMIAISGSTGGLLRSDDGGRSWATVVGPRLASLTWGERGAPVGAASDGTVFEGEDDGRSWSAIGKLSGTNPVLAAVDDELVAGTDGGVISRSSDGGKSWQTQP